MVASQRRQLAKRCEPRRNIAGISTRPLMFMNLLLSTPLPACVTTEVCVPRFRRFGVQRSHDDAACVCRARDPHLRRPGSRVVGRYSDESDSGLEFLGLITGSHPAVAAPIAQARPVPDLSSSWSLG